MKWIQLALNTNSTSSERRRRRSKVQTVEGKRLQADGRKGLQQAEKEWAGAAECEGYEAAAAQISTEDSDDGGINTKQILFSFSQECNNIEVEPPYDDSMNPSSEPCPLNFVIKEVPDHNHISDDEIPRAGMCFDSLEEAHDFYKNYAEKVGFVMKIRNTNHVKNDKGEKIPINLSIHCNQQGNRMSRAKALRGSKKITAAMCNARVYVKFNKDNSKWFYSIVEGKHSHHYSPKKSCKTPSLCFFVSSRNV
ncbi:hypothetical protein PIB30_056114 [Stylosanthes scabra]|uniref:FAR1 domain-containing protein n=1 Tax=Stylosanthes scabra TaxID=79078 RepID=A0ABU6ZHZ2_9FABA|nr:hypothetical protein [Stylosanthes scabra]